MKELTHKNRSWRGPAIDLRPESTKVIGSILIEGTFYDAQINDDDDCPVSIWVSSK